MQVNRWLRAAACALTLTAASPLLWAQEIVVSAAASLTNAFQAVGKAWSQANPGHKATFNFAASGALLAQMQQGAPVDVFASADQPTMDKAQAAGLIAQGTRSDFVKNELVLIVPAKSSKVPKSLDDLAGGAYQRIAAGTPASVPVGRYTMGVIEQAKLDAPLKPKWIYGESVRQVLDYVARGEVDAGFVYRTDAMVKKDETQIAFAVPTTTPVTYPIAQLAASKQPAAAQSFIAFVKGAEGRKILQSFGFAQP
ncbi:molybdate ABC transporter substrate-binding protein [Xenophilus azovorans]|uniref:molybdate ABC transporter substrate-binding protein n=1 Tax=Xenophilus azovorans TaxID=151755 RepID=UPI00057079BF|nr:molybdate ABC transporter substrate-binding protein [Xenophilus azovorans]